MNADAATQVTVAPATGLQQTRVGLEVHPQLAPLVLPPAVASQLEIGFELAPVPNAKPWLRGVLNLRGNLVPVFDMGLWCGLGALPARMALVIAPGPRALAVLCAATPELVSVGPGQDVSPEDPMFGLAARRYSGAEQTRYELDLPGWIARVAADLPGRST